MKPKVTVKIKARFQAYSRYVYSGNIFGSMELTIYSDSGENSIFFVNIFLFV
ncbi:hypothetical protein G906_02459 [Escherichia coli UMEA 3088-1]|nr:hypothetical protein G906_02459 [Escherichia coli UMEA 3088-1]